MPVERGEARERGGSGLAGLLRVARRRAAAGPLVLVLSVAACLCALTSASAVAGDAATFPRQQCQWVDGTCGGTSCIKYLGCADCSSVPVAQVNATTVWVRPRAQKQQECSTSSPSLTGVQACEVVCPYPYAMFPSDCAAGLMFSLDGTRCVWSTVHGTPCRNLRCLPNCSQPPRMEGNGTVTVQHPTYAKLASLNVGTTAAATCDIWHAGTGTSATAHGGFNCRCIATQDSGSSGSDSNASAEWADASNARPCNLTCTRCPALPRAAPGATRATSSPPFVTRTKNGVAVTTVSNACASGSLSVSANCSCLSVSGVPVWMDSRQPQTLCDPTCASPICPQLPAHNSTVTATPAFGDVYAGVANPGQDWSEKGGLVEAAGGGSVITRLTWTCDPGFCFYSSSDGLCRRSAVDMDCVVSRSPVTGRPVATWVEVPTQAWVGRVDLVRGCQPLALACPNLANQTATAVTRCTYWRNVTEVPAGTVCATACFLGAELANDNSGPDTGSDTGNGTVGETARVTTCTMPPNGFAPGGQGAWTAPVPTCDTKEEVDLVEVAFGQVFEVSVLGVVLSAAHSMSGSLFGTTRVPAATVRQHVALGQHMFTMSVFADAQASTPATLDDFVSRLSWSGGGLDMGNVAESLSEFFDGFGSCDECDDAGGNDESGDDGGCCDGEVEVAEVATGARGPDAATPPRQTVETSRSGHEFNRFWQSTGPHGLRRGSTHAHRAQCSSAGGTDGHVSTATSTVTHSLAPGSEVYHLLHCDDGVTRPPVPCNVSVAGTLNVGPGDAVATAIRLVLCVVGVAGLAMFACCGCVACCIRMDSDSDVPLRCLALGSSIIGFTLVQFLLAMLPTFTSVSVSLVQHSNAVWWLAFYSGGLVLVVTLAGYWFGTSASREVAKTHVAERGSCCPSATPQARTQPLTRREALEHVEAWDGQEWGEGPLGSSLKCACCFPVYREARATRCAVAVVWLAFMIDNIVRPVVLVMLYTNPVACIGVTAANHVVVALLYLVAQPKRHKEWVEISSVGGLLRPPPRGERAECCCCSGACGYCCAPVRTCCFRPAFWLVLTNGGEATLRVLDAVSALLTVAYTTDHAWACPSTSATVRAASANAIKFIEAFAVTSHVLTSLVSIGAKLWLIKCCRDRRQACLNKCSPHMAAFGSHGARARTDTNDDARAHAEVDAEVQQRMEQLTAESRKVHAHARGCMTALTSMCRSALCRRPSPPPATSSSRGAAATRAGQYRRLPGEGELASPKAPHQPTHHDGTTRAVGVHKAEVSLSPRGRSAAP